MKWLLGAVGLIAAPAAAQTTPLFASDDPIHIKIAGPVSAVARSAEDSTAPRDATLSLAGTPETYPIRLSARGITRRLKLTCSFPPLRVDFAQKPPATSLFAGQGRLKLVTHCQNDAGFQQHLLLEYSAYRIFNLISPVSFRARLATVDYAEPNGKVSTTRWGFFIEDMDDAAKRNNMTRAQVGDRILSTQLEPKQAARMALFEYMISNLDWSMRAGPQGEGCCHNGRLLSAKGSPLFVPMPYDFDYSGLVDAPYAVPPEGIPVRSVRTRYYMGYCRFNAEVVAAAAEFRAKRPAIEAMYAQLPLSERTRAKALAYLAAFYSDIATDDSVRTKVLNKCMG
ncbi:MAG TPA: hypothetical protein VL336_05300 [Sphingomicrobium sp.]|jgi:hypothetical protein|nr:hypothetical protein [Sphingomicrobium sp.]